MKRPPATPEDQQPQPEDQPEDRMVRPPIRKPAPPANRETTPPPDRDAPQGDPTEGPARMSRRHKLSAEERRARIDARWKIVQAANRYRIRFHAYHPYWATLFDLRHIQQAVHIARRRRLVKAELLEAAGFRAR